MNSRLLGINVLQRHRDKLLEHMRTQIPGFEIRSKQDSRFMKYLSKLLFFNKAFLYKYVTTLYPRVYVPELPWLEDKPISAISVLAHEYVHLKDRKKMKWLFNFLYLFPQNLSFFFLLFPFSNWWLLCLLFLLPIPSPSRAWLEYRGYRMTLFVYEYYGLAGNLDDFVDWIAEHFVNSTYYWMFPAKGFIKNKLKRDFFLYGSQQKDISEVREIISILERG